MRPSDGHASRGAAVSNCTAHIASGAGHREADGGLGEPALAPGIPG
jgi:hypothetical protein